MSRNTSRPLIPVGKDSPVVSLVRWYYWDFLFLKQGHVATHHPVDLPTEGFETSESIVLGQKQRTPNLLGLNKITINTSISNSIYQCLFLFFSLRVRTTECGY